MQLAPCEVPCLWELEAKASWARVLQPPVLCVQAQSHLGVAQSLWRAHRFGGKMMRVFLLISGVGILAEFADRSLLCLTLGRQRIPACVNSPKLRVGFTRHACLNLNSHGCERLCLQCPQRMASTNTRPLASTQVHFGKPG